MWRLYCPGEDGVAIRTAFAKLRDSVNDPHTCVSEVKYFDYRTGQFLRHIHDWDPAFHKRIAFKHEQEVRVLRHDVADWRQASTHFSVASQEGIRCDQGMKFVQDLASQDVRAPIEEIPGIRPSLETLGLAFLPGQEPHARHP